MNLSFIYEGWREFAKSKLSVGKKTNKLVLAQWVFRVTRRGESGQEIWLSETKDNAIYNNGGNCSLNTTSLSKLKSSATLVSELTSLISSTYKEIQRF
jgi:hypothetical protein